MEVLEIKEHEDGSATFDIDMTEDESELMFKAGLDALQKTPQSLITKEYEEARTAVIYYGLLTAMMRGIESAEKTEKTATAS